jgi:hypothetical protein
MMGNVESTGAFIFILSGVKDPFVPDYIMSDIFLIIISDITIELSRRGQNLTMKIDKRLSPVGLNDWLCGFVIMFSVFLFLIYLHFFIFSLYNGISFLHNLSTQKISFQIYS